MNAEKIRPDPSQMDTSGYDSAPDSAAIALQTKDYVLPQSYLDMVDAEPDPEIRKKLMRISGMYKCPPACV